MTPKLVTSPKIEAEENYIRANRSKCRKCKLPVFWCSTSTGRRIPIDFPSTALHGHLPKTHELVMGTSEGGYDGSMEAWPSTTKATHTCHFDTCEGEAVKHEFGWEQEPPKVYRTLHALLAAHPDLQPIWQERYDSTGGRVYDRDRHMRARAAWDAALEERGVKLATRRHPGIGFGSGWTVPDPDEPGFQPIDQDRYGSAAEEREDHR
jgi:hypothetical protein